jgi:mitotic spindle assembly checkpoint protein MAD1
VNATQAIEVLREENRALERRTASADELRDIVMRLEAEVEAARAEREAWCVSPFLFFPLSFVFVFMVRTSWVHLGRETRRPETPATTPVSITQSLSALRLEHAHLLEEHGAGCAVLHRREAELADVQAREVDARATADALLQTTRAAEDRATRAERTAALAEREVGFLNALNVRSPLDCLACLSSLGS